MPDSNPDIGIGISSGSDSTLNGGTDLFSYRVQKVTVATATKQTRKKIMR